MNCIALSGPLRLGPVKGPTVARSSVPCKMALPGTVSRLLFQRVAVMRRGHRGTVVRKVVSQANSSVNAVSAAPGALMESKSADSIEGACTPLLEDHTQKCCNFHAPT